MAPLIDRGCDAKIWFEAFKNPNERSTLFNATTWDESYDNIRFMNI